MKFADMYPKDRFYAAEFKGKPWTLTFRETDPPTDPVTHELLGKGGPSEKMMPIWHFNETTKTMPAVVTNGVCARAIMQTVLGKVEGDESNNWPGHKITLYPAPDPSGMSDDGLCIRVLGSPELKKPLVFNAQIGRTKKTFTLKPTGNGKAPAPVPDNVDSGTGEVFGFDDAPPTDDEEALSSASDDADDSDGADGLFAPETAESEDDDIDVALGNVQPIREPAATQAQLAAIQKLIKSTGVYEAELAGILDSYGATTPRDLSQKNAQFVVAALKERQS
jgi:hypothetical protein